MPISIVEYKSMIQSYISLKRRFKLSSVLRERNLEFEKGGSTSAKRDLMPYYPFALLINPSSMEYSPNSHNNAVIQGGLGPIWSPQANVEHATLSFNGTSGNLEEHYNSCGDSKEILKSLNRYLQVEDIPDVLNEKIVDPETGIVSVEKKFLNSFIDMMSEIVDTESAKRKTYLMLKAWAEEPNKVESLDETYINWKILTIANDMYPMGKTYYGFVESFSDSNSAADGGVYRKNDWSLSFRVYGEKVSDFFQKGVSSAGDPGEVVSITRVREEIIINVEEPGKVELPVPIVEEPIRKDDVCVESSNVGWACSNITGDYSINCEVKSGVETLSPVSSKVTTGSFEDAKYEAIVEIIFSVEVESVDIGVTNATFDLEQITDKSKWNKYAGEHVENKSWQIKVSELEPNKEYALRVKGVPVDKTTTNEPKEHVLNIKVGEACKEPPSFVSLIDTWDAFDPCYYENDIPVAFVYYMFNEPVNFLTKDMGVTGANIKKVSLAELSGKDLVDFRDLLKPDFNTTTDTMKDQWNNLIESWKNSGIMTDLGEEFITGVIWKLELQFLPRGPKGTYEIKINPASITSKKDSSSIVKFTAKQESMSYEVNSLDVSKLDKIVINVGTSGLEITPNHTGFFDIRDIQNGKVFIYVRMTDFVYVENTQKISDIFEIRDIGSKSNPEIIENETFILASRQDLVDGGLTQYVNLIDRIIGGGSNWEANTIIQVGVQGVEKDNTYKFKIRDEKSGAHFVMGNCEQRIVEGTSANFEVKGAVCVRWEWTSIQTVISGAGSVRFTAEFNPSAPAYELKDSFNLVVDGVYIPKNDIEVIFPRRPLGGDVSKITVILKYDKKFINGTNYKIVHFVEGCPTAFEKELKVVETGCEYIRTELARFVNSDRFTSTQKASITYSDPTVPPGDPSLTEPPKNTFIDGKVDPPESKGPKGEQGVSLNILSQLTFGFGKDIIQSEGKKVLDVLADFLNDNPGLIIYVDGHTDRCISTRPSDHYKYSLSWFNWDLGKRRSQAVVDYLKRKATNVTYISRTYGEVHPKKVNGTIPDSTCPTVNTGSNERVRLNEIREPHRRVEIVIRCDNIK